MLLGSWSPYARWLTESWGSVAGGQWRKFSALIGRLSSPVLASAQSKCWPCPKLGAASCCNDRPRVGKGSSGHKQSFGLPRSARPRDELRSSAGRCAIAAASSRPPRRTLARSSKPVRVGQRRPAESLTMAASRCLIAKPDPIEPAVWLLV